MLFSEKLFPKVLEFVDLLGRVAKPIIENIEERLRNFLNDPGLAVGNFVKNLDKVQVGFTKVINGLITGVNIMTRGMLKFIEQLNELWTINMLPDSTVKITDSIKKDEADLSKIQRQANDIALVLKYAQKKEFEKPIEGAGQRGMALRAKAMLDRIPEHIQKQLDGFERLACFRCPQPLELKSDVVRVVFFSLSLSKAWPAHCLHRGL